MTGAIQKLSRQEPAPDGAGFPPEEIERRRAAVSEWLRAILYSRIDKARTALPLALVIADRIDLESMEYSEPMKKIAEDIGVERRSVNRYSEYLRDTGFVTIINETFTRPNIYKIRLPDNFTLRG